MHHMHGLRRNHWGRGIGFVVLILVGISAMTWVVMQLWNALLPDLFGWHTLSYFQALGILILSKILFGGWHRGGRGWHHHGGHGWAHLSDEEREKIRSRFRERCCGVDHEAPNQNGNP